MQPLLAATCELLVVCLLSWTSGAPSHQVVNTTVPTTPYCSSLRSESLERSLGVMLIAFALQKKHIKDLRAAIRSVFKQHGKSFEDSNMTRHDLPYVLSLVSVWRGLGR